MASQSSLSARSWLGLVILAALWGGSFLAIRIALHEVGPNTIVAFRCLGACVILWGAVIAMRLPVPRAPRVWLGFVVLGLLNNAIPFTLISWAQLSVPSGLAAILNASTAIFGVLIASLLLRDERLTALRLIGVGFGFAGVIVVIGPDILHSLDLTSLSQLALIGAAVSYAFAGVVARVTMRGVAPQMAAAGMLTVSAAITAPAALLIDGVPQIGSAATAISLAYLAAASTALAYLLYYRLLSVAGAGNTSLATLLVAPIAIVLGAIVLDESLPLRAFAGFVLLGLGLLIIDGRIFSRVPRSAAR